VQVSAKVSAKVSTNDNSNTIHFNTKISIRNIKIKERFNNNNNDEYFIANIFAKNENNLIQ